MPRARLAQTTAFGPPQAARAHENKPAHALFIVASSFRRSPAHQEHVGRTKDPCLKHGRGSRHGQRGSRATRVSLERTNPMQLPPDYQLIRVISPGPAATVALARDAGGVVRV